LKSTDLLGLIDLVIYILIVEQVAFPSRGLLLYAFTDTTAEKAASTRFLEVKAFSKTESAPIIALGQGTYTMTRIEALVN
jgi:hypothetical protein